MIDIIIILDISIIVNINNKQYYTSYITVIIISNVLILFSNKTDYVITLCRL